jgi:hypothetical protein
VRRSRRTAWRFRFAVIALSGNCGSMSDHTLHPTTRKQATQRSHFSAVNAERKKVAPLRGHIGKGLMPTVRVEIPRAPPLRCNLVSRKGRLEKRNMPPKPHASSKLLQTSASLSARKRQIARSRLQVESGDSELVPPLSVITREQSTCQFFSTNSDSSPPVSISRLKARGLDSSRC